MSEEEERKSATSRAEYHRLNFTCDVCLADLPRFGMYIVKTEVWQSSGIGDGNAHLRCLEQKIGRALRFDDFKPECDCNENILFMAGKQ